MRNKKPITKKHMAEILSTLIYYTVDYDLTIEQMVKAYDDEMVKYNEKYDRGKHIRHTVKQG